MPASFIVLYHSVDRRGFDSDYWNLAVAPETFREQIAYLSAEYDVVPLRDIGRCYDSNKALPTGCVAITFDDGYLDNLINAKPILLAHSAPATVFVATGYMGAEAYWWDDLEEIVSGATESTESVRVQSQQQTLDICFRDRARSAVLEEIWQAIRYLDAEHRTSLIEELRETLQLSPRKNTSRPMTSEQVRQLGDGGIDIGAHTVTHPSLPSMTDDRIASEVRRSKAECENMLGMPVTTFAYPFGESDSRTQAIVRDAGFELACSTRPSVLSESDNVLALPRIAVGNWSVEKLDQVIRDAQARTG